ncbi:hypothetical protein PG996_012908 [Apiospora saccharicola]|uniref:Uncharacterized protein n=1 Tax=Apiospora saccharicola TaxID=335842 RepID=A0ABR1U3Y7_9PEZI
MDDDRFGLVVVSRIEDVSVADQAWFHQQALYAIRRTVPDAVLNDIMEPNGKYLANVTLWLSDVFENGQWNSTMAPPRSRAVTDSPAAIMWAASSKTAKSFHDWAKALEREIADIEPNQRDHLRKSGAATYLRATVPAQFVAFAGGRTGPSDEARAQALALQDVYQARLTAQWNGCLVVHFFRKRLYNSRNEIVPREGQRLNTAHDYRKTPKVFETIESLAQSIQNVRRILHGRGVKNNY